jgi:hypothetical protein
MKVELELRDKYYIEYYKLDIKKELWNDVLMDLMPKEEIKGRRRGGGDVYNVGN